MQDTDVGGGPVVTDALKVKAHKGKGTTTVTLDFDDSDDDIFDKTSKMHVLLVHPSPQLM